MNIKQIAVLASGSGTNAENITKYFSDSKVASVKLIITDNPNAQVIKRSERLGVDSYILSKEELALGGLSELLIERNIDFVALAGFLKLIPADVTKHYMGRIVNIHPALLPKYGGKGMYGLNVHRSVIEAGDAESGITIHLVNSEYDKGEIVFQTKCPVLQCDKPETLAKRVHSLEYEYYPVIIERLIKNI